MLEANFWQDKDNSKKVIKEKKPTRYGVKLGANPSSIPKFSGSSILFGIIQNM